MKILVLSDIHSAKMDLNLSKYDRVFICGDYGKNYNLFDNKNIHIVKGNCDLKGSEELIINFNSKKIFLTHGNNYNVKYSYNSLIYKTLSIGANICLFGHTHKSDIFIEDNVLFLNPGSYLEGYYCEIEDDIITIYCRGNIYKRIDYRW
ncbi:MAG: YfcE family phosphodiesterase [Anaeroplasma sp.]